MGEGAARLRALMDSYSQMLCARKSHACYRAQPLIRPSATFSRKGRRKKLIFPCRTEDGFDDAVQRLIQLMIPESQHAESFALQECRSDRIGRDGFWLIVTIAVELYYQLGLEADEVCNVRQI